jgi:hypothetical protein
MEAVLLANKIDPNSHYNEELELLDKALAEIEELYDETKEHFDVVKNSRSKGSLSFVHLQTSNLISLKGSKFQIIKEKLAVKKNMADLTMKQRAAEDAGDKDKELVRQIMGALINNDNNPELKGVQYEDDDGEAEDIDAIIERQIAAKESEGKLEFSDNDKAVRYEKMGGEPPKAESPADELEEGVEEEEVSVDNQKTKVAVRVANKKWSFVAVNELGEIVKGAEVPDKKKYKMKLTKVGGETVAVDQDDRMYEVIKG